MPEDIKLSQIGSSQLPPPFRGLHSPGVRKHCQIIFARYFRKSSIIKALCNTTASGFQARSKDQEILEEGGGAGPSLLPRRDHE